MARRTFDYLRSRLQSPALSSEARKEWIAGSEAALKGARYEELAGSLDRMSTLSTLKDILRPIASSQVFAPFMRWYYRIASYSIVRGPFRYKANGLYTVHNADFMNDPDFIAARQIAKDATGMDHPAPWRVYVNCWAASQAMTLNGCLVECGTWKGYTARVVMEFLRGKRGIGQWSELQEFYLIDSFRGLDLNQLTEAERNVGLESKNTGMYYQDFYQEVSDTFRDLVNVKLVRGFVPDVLKEITAITNIGYLHIDLNAAAPEIAAAEFFWPRLASGAIVVLDDYGFKKHIGQKRAFDEFAKAHGVSILTLPTGQGIIVKA